MHRNEAPCNQIHIHTKHLNVFPGHQNKRHTEMSVYTSPNNIRNLGLAQKVEQRNVKYRVIQNFLDSSCHVQNWSKKDKRDLLISDKMLGIVHFRSFLIPRFLVNAPGSSERKTMHSTQDASQGN